MEIRYRQRALRPGRGDSAGLARGLSVIAGRADITGEGMGIGTPALRDGFTYFASESGAERPRPGRFVKKFVIDRRLVVSVFGRPSSALTKMVERSTDWYAAHPSLQKILLRLSLLARKAFRMKIGFRGVPPLAEAVVAYAVRGGEVDVDCSVRGLRRACFGTRRVAASLIMLNEVEAGFFDAALRGGKPVPLPSGWMRLPARKAGAALVNSRHRLAFSVRLDRVIPRVEPKLFWGSERSSEIRWAGFDYEFDAAPLRDGEIEIRYRVGFGPIESGNGGRKHG